MNKIDHTIYDNFQPLPENIQGWHGTSALFATLIDDVKPRHIIEVGTWMGQSAITMAEHLVATGRDNECRITCVDHWTGAREFWAEYAHTPDRNLMLRHGYPQVYYQFLSNVVHRKVQHIILPLPTTSAIAAQVLAYRKETADLIYIDASHDAADVEADCHAYWRLLNMNGVMFGDDWSWPGLAPAVRRFADWHGLAIETIEGFWIVRK
jgi:predicted O-methyltransferase YrrM